MIPRSVRQAVKRSPQATCLIVTPDWPSRKRETNWGCGCSTAPGRSAPPPAPRGGACRRPGGRGRRPGRPCLAPACPDPPCGPGPPQPAHLPEDKAPRARDARLLRAPSCHLDHLCVEHRQPQRGAEPTAPRVDRRQRWRNGRPCGSPGYTPAAGACGPAPCAAGDHGWPWDQGLLCPVGRGWGWGFKTWPIPGTPTRRNGGLARSSLCPRPIVLPLGAPLGPESPSLPAQASSCGCSPGRCGG